MNNKNINKKLTFWSLFWVGHFRRPFVWAEAVVPISPSSFSIRLLIHGFAQKCFPSRTFSPLPPICQTNENNIKNNNINNENNNINNKNNNIPDSFTTSSNLSNTNENNIMIKMKIFLVVCYNNNIKEGSFWKKSHWRLSLAIRRGSFYN